MSRQANFGGNRIFCGMHSRKAHSASFVAFVQVAFLKSHYPAEFMASVLSNMGDFILGSYVWNASD
jgi:DNA polymerase III alpha subunit